MRSKLWSYAALPLVIALTVLALACGDDDDDGGSEEDKAAVEQTARELAGYGADDVDAFLERVTDNALENFFGFTREECRDSAFECVGEPSEAVSFAKTGISGDTATTEVSFSNDEGEEETFQLSLVREDDKWKVDGVSSVAKEIPAGVKKIDLELSEFAFGFNRSEITDGNFAFVVKNAGEQTHEVIVLKVPDNLDIAEAFLSEQEPQDVEDIAFAGPYPSGDEGTVVFDEGLGPGRYALICFRPDTDDPDRTPHISKGMYGDFTVE